MSITAARPRRILTDFPVTEAAFAAPAGFRRLQASCTVPAKSWFSSPVLMKSAAVVPLINALYNSGLN